MSAESNTPTMADALEAVLLFHSPEPWTEEKRLKWLDLTGKSLATEFSLCDTVRRALKEGK